MLQKIILVSFCCILSAPVISGNLKSDIPLSIDSVQTHRVADSLIRIIRYNMEFTPKLVIQRIETPKLKLSQQLIINKLKIKDKIIDFNHSAGTFIESLNLIKGIVKFTVMHYYPGTSGGEITLNCKVDVNNNKISNPICKEK